MADLFYTISALVSQLPPVKVPVDALLLPVCLAAQLLFERSLAQRY